MPGDSLHINNKAVQQQTYDAIVVGSGISGGWAAKELCENGLKVLMLERGRNFEHVKDYHSANKDPWDFEHRGNVTRESLKERPVIARTWGKTEPIIDYWVKDNEVPYTEIKPFKWWRAYQLGGRSILWGRQSYRWSDLDFEANAKDGWAIDWPIRYRDIAPWYDHVEKHIGVSGSHEGIAHLPDGQFLPPMDMTCVEKDVAARIKEHDICTDLRFHQRDDRVEFDRLRRNQEFIAELGVDRNEIVLLVDLQGMTCVEQQADIGTFEFARELFDHHAKPALSEVKSQMNLEADLLQRCSNIVRIVAGVAQRTCVGIVRITDNQRDTPLRVRRVRGGEHGPPNSDQNRQVSQHRILR